MATLHDDTANHPDHDGLRAQHLDLWSCAECDEPTNETPAQRYGRERSEQDAADIIARRRAEALDAVDAVPGIPTTPALDALAAEPLGADAVDELAAALGSPDADADELRASLDRQSIGNLWCRIVDLARQDRRARARRMDGDNTDDVAGAACRLGIVPCRHRVASAGAARQREASTVIGSWRHLADVARQRDAGAEALDYGPWRGNNAADVDAGTERYRVEREPLAPIYAAGRERLDHIALHHAISGAELYDFDYPAID